MTDEKRRKLIELGSDVLADTLLNLEKQSDEAADIIERLLATPESAAAKFKKLISGIKRSRKFYDWRESGRFARKLETMLLDLQHSVKNPELGLDLVVSFLKLAPSVFERVDDSNGYFGDVFRYTATNVFTHFAKESREHTLIADHIFTLLAENEYGECDCLLDDAPEFLRSEDMRELSKRFRESADGETDQWRKHHWLIPVETLAAHLNDPEAFEEARLAAFDDEPGTAACIEIAARYLEAENEEKALSWAEKVPTTERFMAYERDSLLVRLYRSTGNREKLEAAAWRIFRRHRSAETLAELLESVKEKKSSIVEKEKELIFANPEFSSSDTNFLISCGETGAAEEYVIAREDQVNGDYYESVSGLAKELEKNGLHHGAIIAYRALLDSILRRGRTKAYYYGARYLKKLDKMSLVVEKDWRGIENHKFYVEALRRDHGRKYSFWSRYEGD